MPARALTPPQREQRRNDLALAAQLLRRQIDAELAQLQPAADRVLIGVDVAWWIQRHWPARTPRQRRVAAAFAVLGGVLGVSGFGRLALRYRRWLRAAWVAWRVWHHARH